MKYPYQTLTLGKGMRYRFEMFSWTFTEMHFQVSGLLLTA